MLIKETIVREIENIPENLLKEIYDFILFVKRKSSGKDKVLTHIASESSLAKDWDLKEEDEAWKDL